MISPIAVATDGLFCGSALSIGTLGFLCPPVEIPQVVPSPIIPPKTRQQLDDEEVLLAVKAYLRARQIRREQRVRSGRL